MINPELHRQPVALNREQHRTLKLRADVNHLMGAASLNAVFLTGTEFVDACKHYPILFLSAGQDAHGRAQAASVAVFGLNAGENLFVTPDGWDAPYVPATLRSYPFTLARVEQEQYALCFDGAAPGISMEQGEPLFDDAGEPTPLLEDLHALAQQVEIEAERTRLMGMKLMELGLLRPKRFDAKLSDGTPIVVDGFMAVDEDRLNKLGDAELALLQRSGLMALVHAHLISLGNMRGLIERRLAQAETAAAVALASAASKGAGAAPT